ncbi:MAG: hypothetical protein ABIH42_01955 [Planctomycetota bacterium]
MKTILFFVVLCIVLFAIAYAFKDYLYVIISAVILFLSMSKFFLPTQYCADNNGISYSFLGIKKFREWKTFKNAYFHSTGIHLAPFEQPSSLDSFRGLFILYGKGNKAEIKDFITTQIQIKKSENTIETESSYNV